MKSGLGRGFESLIPTELVDEQFDLTASEDKASSELLELPLDKIERDREQPRQEFDKDALVALAQSISEQGVLQPIVVTREGSKYKIVAGERRWRAAKIAGLEKIPAIVRTLTAQNRLELSIIENAQREDLNAIELATAYAKLMSQFNLTEEDVAKRVGKNKTSVRNTLRLLKLPEPVKKMMVVHKLSEGVMRPLISAEPEIVEAVMPKIIDEGWPVRKVERYVAQNKKKSSARAIKAHAQMKIEDGLSAKYGVEVVIKNSHLVFKCRTEEELRRVIDELK